MEEPKYKYGYETHPDFVYVPDFAPEVEEVDATLSYIRDNTDWTAEGVAKAIGKDILYAEQIILDLRVGMGIVPRPKF